MNLKKRNWITSVVIFLLVLLICITTSNADWTTSETKFKIQRLRNNEGYSIGTSTNAKELWNIVKMNSSSTYSNENTYCLAHGIGFGANDTQPNDESTYGGYYNMVTDSTNVSTILNSISNETNATNSENKPVYKKDATVYYKVLAVLDKSFIAEYSDSAQTVLTDDSKANKSELIKEVQKYVYDLYNEAEGSSQR